MAAQNISNHRNGGFLAAEMYQGGTENGRFFAVVDLAAAFCYGGTVHLYVLEWRICS
jgi:hypothetical protein